MEQFGTGLLTFRLIIPSLHPDAPREPGIMTDTPPPPFSSPASEPPPAPPPIVRAEELFGSAREVCIEFEGVRYRLRITRRGKLILQK